jgi:hypothetical protein
MANGNVEYDPGSNAWGSVFVNSFADRGIAESGKNGECPVASLQYVLI